jgi:hypothetical protein
MRFHQKIGVEPGGSYFFVDHRKSRICQIFQFLQTWPRVNVVQSRVWLSLFDTFFLRSYSYLYRVLPGNTCKNWWIIQTPLPPHTESDLGYNPVKPRHSSSRTWFDRDLGYVCLYNSGWIFCGGSISEKLVRPRWFDRDRKGAWQSVLGTSFISERKPGKSNTDTQTFRDILSRFRTFVNILVPPVMWLMTEYCWVPGGLGDWGTGGLVTGRLGTWVMSIWVTG